VSGIVIRKKDNSIAYVDDVGNLGYWKGCIPNETEQTTASILYKDATIDKTERVEHEGD
jgi:hypothetical protein